MATDEEPKEAMIAGMTASINGTRTDAPPGAAWANPLDGMARATRTSGTVFNRFLVVIWMTGALYILG
jgi:hypothetical protein